MNDLNRAKIELKSGKYTCVICKGKDIYTSTERGVKPLVSLIEKGMCFKNFCAADKVVGKATAFLYILLRVKAVYANVISKSAYVLLREHNIGVEYSKAVENIVNRRGDGICPFERTVVNIKSSKRAYELIRKKMDELNIFV